MGCGLVFDGLILLFFHGVIGICVSIERSGYISCCAASYLRSAM
jgi:hypothetical protein